MKIVVIHCDPLRADLGALPLHRSHSSDAPYGGACCRRGLVCPIRDKVERLLADRPVPGIEIETVFNPFYATTDNLATVWLAQSAMTGDFMLLNGDTMFESEVARRLLSSPNAPLTLAISREQSYDDDEMKVSLTGESRVGAISKNLSPELVDGKQSD